MRNILFLVLFALSPSAFAYLDPGTGSMVLQMLIAGLLSALFAVKMFWLRIKSFFTGEKLSIDKDDELDDGEKDKEA